MSFRSLSRNSYEQSSEAKAHVAADATDVAYKLVMVGDSGVGKSCLLEKLIDTTSSNTFISTIGVDIRSHTFKLHGHNVKLQVWDTGGQQRYRPVLSSCYRNAFGVILVFDVTNQRTFNNLHQWMSEVSEFSHANIPKLLIGNKSDLIDRREVNKDRAEQFAKENGMNYFETSAIQMSNIREAFVSLVKENV